MNSNKQGLAQISLKIAKNGPLWDHICQLKSQNVKVSPTLVQYLEKFLQLK